VKEPKALTLVTLLFLISIASVSADLVINEIMYDPAGNLDDDLEWIEIFNNGTEKINFTDWQINEKPIGNIKLNPQEFIVIARELLDDSDNDKINFESVYGNNDSTWNSADKINAIEVKIVLTNSGGAINLTNSTKTYLAKYNSSLGGNNNGKSLEFIDGIFLESIENSGTPGRKNSVNITSNFTANYTANITGNFTDNQTSQENKSEIPLKGMKLSIILDEPVYRGFSYKNLFRIENLDYVQGGNFSINVTVEYNISNVKTDSFTITNMRSYATAGTGDFIINQTGNFTLCGRIINSTVNDTNKSDDYSCKKFTVIEQIFELCDASSEIVADKFLYINETIEFSNKINNMNNTEFPFTIDYWVEDLAGNTIRAKSSTNNQNKKQFTPNTGKNYEVYVIKNFLSVQCNDTNLSNNFAEKIVVYRRQDFIPESVPEKESRIWIDDIILPSETIKRGDSIKVRLRIYRGDTRKNSVKVWIAGAERISEDTNLNLFDDFTDNEIIVSVKTKERCNIPSGNYKVVAEGLDTYDKDNVRIDFFPCENKTSAKAVKSHNENVATKVIKENLPVQNSKSSPKKSLEYKSSMYAIKSVIPWFIAIIASIIAIVLIWKR